MRQLTAGCTLPENAKAARVVTGPGQSTVYVYPENDTVSTFIRRYGSWESEEIDQVLWAMATPVPVRPGWLGPGPDLFVDIGANLAWFTVNVASHGYRVAAFEGMPRNLQMIRSTICANPQYSSFIRLFPAYLGTESGTCWTFALAINLGNGITNCNATSEAAALASMPEGYALRGKVDVRRLDELLPHEDIKVMKIDVEGYEHMVLQGGKGIFATQTVWFMIMEFTYSLTQATLKGRHPKEHLRFLVSLGFRLSHKSFRGPFANGSSEAELENLCELSKAGVLVNLYCVNERYFELQPDANDTPLPAWLG